MKKRIVVRELEDRARTFELPTPACVSIVPTNTGKEKIMPRGKQSKGQCVYCKIEGAKNGMARHLTTCEKRQELMHEAEHSKRDRETLYHLRIQDAWRPDFWLDVEIGGSRTLKDLDFYLRGIWLECCGHLSQFSLGG